MNGFRATANVRISPRAHQLLRQLAEEEPQPMQAILDRALERYRRENVLRAAKSGFEVLRRDSKAWKEELEVRELCEPTLADGLAKE